MRPYILWISLTTFLAGCASTATAPILATVPSGKLTWVEDLPVLHLKGSAYEIGYQHGSLLRGRVRASVANALAFIRKEVRLPVVGKWVAYRMLDRSWSQMAPFVGQDLLEEMKGLSDGAQIPLITLQRIHALPELMATTCSSFAALGPATKDGRLIHMRNLDWAIQSDVQKFSALFVVRPTGKEGYLSVGWLGFVGVITGINEGGISVAEIGSETLDVSLKGTPMPFLLKRVLEEAKDLSRAVDLIEKANRTGGYNYLLAESEPHRAGVSPSGAQIPSPDDPMRGITPREHASLARENAVVLETTHKHCAVFSINGKEPDVPFKISVLHTIFRGDWSLDPTVRDLQLACKGNPKRPGLESPVGSKAYDVRYYGLGQLLREFSGKIDPEIAMSIARAVAPTSNIQSVVFSYPYLWVANARRRQPAASTRYLRVDLSELFL